MIVAILAFSIGLTFGTLSKESNCERKHIKRDRIEHNDNESSDRTMYSSTLPRVR